MRTHPLILYLEGLALQYQKPLGDYLASRLCLKMGLSQNNNIFIESEMHILINVSVKFRIFHFYIFSILSQKLVFIN